MSLHYTESGYIALCDSGYVAETADCPCGCPPFEGRVIAYVDKHATGSGDGTSWADAYTDIQTAIDNDPKKEIQIQGYGESDAYIERITMGECTYIKGFNDVWIDGFNGSTNALKVIDGSLIVTAKMENISAKNGSTGFQDCSNSIITGCVTKDCLTGFSGCISSNFLNCISNGNTLASILVFGFRNCDFSTFTNCESNNNSQSGFRDNNGCTFLNCISEYNWGVGYFINEDSFFVDCLSRFNEQCGFKDNINSTFTNCTTSNDCLSTGGDCTGQGCDI